MKNEVFKMKIYRKRVADDILKRRLEGKGAVLIEGPKWCGKTTTAEQIAASILYMDDPEKKAQNIATNGSLLLSSGTRSALRWIIAANSDNLSSLVPPFRQTPQRSLTPAQDVLPG